ncbi:MAG: HIT family protein [Rhodospirillaceae bacterium]|jgi:diadenosine tetraphosphate (Ap4A) HIT family hydrolase|nr:HIT family protein [Rhodospirillaceae bacterium]MBT5659438.1 HIT family protein [Rhodospirillaceae bacterium]MBT5751233.1 HIT family protein [Rhodospirillaceae bacterium]
MTGFTLHARLDADGVFIADWPLSRVLLMDEAKFPWLILVPRRDGLTEIADLDEAARNLLMAESVRAGEALKSLFPCDKLNIAALGNQVSQLHVHVIARHAEDSAWPQPVWGTSKNTYGDEALAEIVERLKTALA